MFAAEIPGMIWNKNDNILHDMIKNEELIYIEETINQCTEPGIITAWHMAAIKDNPIFILTLIEFQKYNLNILYSLIPYFDETPDINQQIIIECFKSLVLKETNLSIINYKYCHYYLITTNLIPPAVENSLEIIARGFKSTRLHDPKNAKIMDILSMIMWYLDTPSYAKLFKEVTEKDGYQSMIDYGSQLLNTPYKLLFECCCTSNVDETLNKPNTRDNIVKSLNKLYEEPKNKFTDLFYWMSTEDLDDTVDEIMKSAELQKQSTYLDLHLEIHNIHHDSIMDPIIL